MLSNPLALAGLLGLLVPLLIHLWERREGKLVQVGSIAWMEEVEEQQVSRFRFTDLWRFLLRAGVIILFVLLLTGPFRDLGPTSDDKRHWILLAPQLSTSRTVVAMVDSLQKQGRPVRMLLPGFPEWASERAFPIPPATTNYWSLLRELSRFPAAPDTVTVLAYPLQRQFDGERPNLPIHIEWPSLPVMEGRPFLSFAWLRHEKVELILGLSQSDGLFFERATIPATAGRQELPKPFPPIILKQEAAPDAWQAQLAGEASTSINLTRDPGRNIWIYYDRDWVRDQNYLRAALRATETFTSIPLNVKWLPVKSFDPLIENESKKGDCLFWLSENALPQGLKTNFAGRVIYYKPSPLYWEDYFYPDQEHLVLYRHLAPDKETSTLDDSLPVALIELIFSDKININPENDDRHLDRFEYLPDFRAERTATEEAALSERRSMHFPIWLLLCLLFLVERLTRRGSKIRP